jgi:dipeptidyl aminopeptidase/acylaminoacyl peptidase
MRTPLGRAFLWGAGLLVPLFLAVPSWGAAPTPAVSGLAVSPDGAKVLVSMDLDGVPNVWELPAAGGPPVPLTKSTRDPVWVVSCFPGDPRFLYRSGPAGDEDHLFAREPDGKAVELFPGKSDRFLGWAADDRSMFVEVFNPIAPAYDLYRITLAGYERTRIDHNSSHISRLAAVSPDARFLAYAENFSDLVRNLRVHDVQTGQDQVQLANEGFVVNIPLRFSPDGKHLLMLSDVDREFRFLVSLDPVTNDRKDLVKQDWDVLDATYSPDGSRIAVVAGGDTRSTLGLYDAATGTPIPLPQFPPVGEVAAAAFSHDGKTLAFLASASDSPPAVWVYNLARPGAPRRLFGGEAGNWVAGEVVRFNTYDKTPIAGILYKPRQASAAHPAPAVIWVHDGPSGQARLAFDPLAQALLQRGYGVYEINQRGSFGYGKTFLQLDDRRHGEGDLQDCIASKAMLAATGWVDAGRIAIGGTGFGAFLALDALAFKPQEFAAGIDLFGVANWQRLMNGMSYTSSERTVLADEMGHAPDLQAAVHMVPVAHAGDIVRPLLIVQGARDALAIPAEAADIVAAMKKNQRRVEEVVLPDAAHGLLLRGDREKVYSAVADFLDRALKPGAGR